MKELNLKSKFYLASDREYVITVTPVSKNRAMFVKCTDSEGFKVMAPFFTHHGLRQGLLDSDTARWHLYTWFVFVTQFHPDRANRQADRVMNAIAVA